MNYFGAFGGQFVAEPLIEPLASLAKAFDLAKESASFLSQWQQLQANYIGRPTPLTKISRISRRLGGANIFLKREDLAHSGAHKINNAIGQALLAKFMGKTHIIAETGAGQHGVATATACALLGLKCTIFMGAKDARRQEANLKKIKILGAHIQLVHTGSCTLKDAINEAIRNWISEPDTSFYLIGSVVGPAPYPSIVSYFQKVIGEESKDQILAQTGSLPAAVIACIGGGSNAMGIFQAYLEESQTKLIGVQAAGPKEDKSHPKAPLINGTQGVLHGSKTLILQNSDGQILKSKSIAPGLDYPGVGPQLAYLVCNKELESVEVYDNEALNALMDLSQTEGIIPALESAHALSYGFQLAPKLNNQQSIIINLSGRGDKDIDTVAHHLAKDS